MNIGVSALVLWFLSIAKQLFSSFPSCDGLSFLSFFLVFLLLLFYL